MQLYCHFQASRVSFDLKIEGDSAQGILQGILLRMWYHFGNFLNFTDPSQSLQEDYVTSAYMKHEMKRKSLRIAVEQKDELIIPCL